jgi:CheY-like chemotaxis protein
VFEAFRQSDSSTTRQYGGTGIGLAITTMLTKLMRGNIRLESEEGHGSRFHLSIPFGLPSEKTVLEMPSVVLNNLRVLLVCRNPRGLRIYQELLESRGAEALTALNPEEALELLEHVDNTGTLQRVVLLDVDGEEAAMDHLVRRLQEDDPARPWHLVALVPADQMEPESLAPFSYCLTKPPTTPELLLAISEAICDDEIADPSRPLDDRLDQAKPLNILLAEDSPVNQEVASGILEIAGHHVISVDDGEQAVEAVNRQSFDVILMDIEMPNMDGLEATRTIRQSEIEQVRNTPIIAMTAHAVSGFRDQCCEAGMDGYIAKPIQPAELFQTIESIVVRGELALG